MTVKLKLLAIILALLQSWGIAAQEPAAEQQIMHGYQADKRQLPLL